MECLRTALELVLNNEQCQNGVTDADPSRDTSTTLGRRRFLVMSFH